MAKRITRPPHIGIDIGKVIMAPVQGGKTDTSFLQGDLARALQTPPSPGAIAGVRRLVEAFGGQAWLISKAGPSVQFKTKQWLRHWDFYRETGLPQSHLRFCLRRPEKAGHCKQLLITHFIDDRLDVLKHLRGLTEQLYLFGEQPKLDRIPDWVVHVVDWRETTERVLADLSGEPTMVAAISPVSN
jgi:hypothetical protein